MGRDISKRKIWCTIKVIAIKERKYKLVSTLVIVIYMPIHCVLEDYGLKLFVNEWKTNIFLIIVSYFVSFLL